MKWTDEHKEDLRRMVAEGKSWRLIGAHLGRNADAVFVRAKAMGLGPKPLKREFSSPIWTLIQRACADNKPRSVHELTLMVGCARSTVDRLMKLHIKAGAAHIAKWKKNDNGSPSPLYLPVAGKNKKRPKALPAAEYQRAYRARIREDDPLRHRVEVDRDYFRRAEREGRLPKQHDIVSALFGGL